MQASLALLLLLPLLSLGSPLLSGRSADSSVPQLPEFTYLFNASLGLGHVFKPVPLMLGGLQLIEVIEGGSITGPALNGTVVSGLTYPPSTPDRSFEYPQVIAYGTSSDNETSFLAELGGDGPFRNQWTRVQMTIGGKYEYLQSEFILAHIGVNPSVTVITVDFWCVACNSTVISIINNGTSLR